jgi:hypothetical protein
MNNYNQVQLAYRDKCKERIQRQLDISETNFLAFNIVFILLIHVIKIYSEIF